MYEDLVTLDLGWESSGSCEIFSFMKLCVNVWKSCVCDFLLEIEVGRFLQLSVICFVAQELRMLVGSTNQLKHYSSTLS